MEFTLRKLQKIERLGKDLAAATRKNQSVVGSFHSAQ